jgi:hypothetical protein
MVLVFLLLILHFRYKIPAGQREWGAMAFVVVGLAMMLIAARPHGGHLEFNGTTWIITVLAIVAAIIVCIAIIRRSSSPKFRAAIGGLAVAANIGLTAGLTKLVVHQANQGFGVLATSWEVYATVASGLLAGAISASVYASGPLVISQPIIEIVNPIVSGIIAVVIFGSIVTTAPASLAVAIPGLLLAIVGLSLIGSSQRYQRQSLAKAPAT